MKYNKSLIFKRAWELKRSGFNFSEALRISWYEAKLIPVKKEVIEDYVIVDEKDYESEYNARFEREQNKVWEQRQREGQKLDNEINDLLSYLNSGIGE